MDRRSAAPNTPDARPCNRPRHDRHPEHRHARQPAGAGPGGSRARGAWPASARTVGRSCRSARPATASPTGRWPKPAARGCSPRRSTRRSSPGASISPSIRPRTCRRAARRDRHRRLPAARRLCATPSCRRGRRSLARLPQGAVIGTASLQARGAGAAAAGRTSGSSPCAAMCETRLQEARSRRGRRHAAGAGRADAARSCRPGRPASSIPTDWLPAPGQGTIAITARAGDAATSATLLGADRPRAPPRWRSPRERAFLAVLDGSCRTPIGGLAEIDGETLRFRGIIVKPDGSVAHDGRAARQRRRGGSARRRCRRRTRPRAAGRISSPAKTCTCWSRDPSPMPAPRRGG